MHASILTLQTKAISRNQLCASQRPARTWFKNAQLFMQKEAKLCYYYSNSVVATF